MNFLECVNRILTANGQMRGDTDPITSFSDTQHNASVRIAIVAVQDELADLIADRILGYERTAATITLVGLQRTYALPANFIRFYGKAHFYSSNHNRQLYEYPGGHVALQIQLFNYETQYGQPNWWYFEPGTTKKVGFFQVPRNEDNGEQWTFEYEASVMVTNSSDTIPLHNAEEANAFTQLAGRRYKFMFEDTTNKQDIQQVLENDFTYKRAKARLASLIVGQNPSRKYSAGYV